MGVVRRKAQRKRATQKCLHCENKAVSRGVCSVCMRKISAGMDSEAYTEQEAIDARLLLPRRVPNTKVTKVDRLIEDLSKRKK